MILKVDKEDLSHKRKFCVNGTYLPRDSMVKTFFLNLNLVPNYF